MEILRDQGLTEQRLLGMEANLEELDQLIGEFLELSKLESGAAILNLQPVSLRSMAEELLQALPDASRFTVNGTAAPIVGDPERLKRVLSTLIENASRYAPEGPVGIQILNGGFRIRDHGPGVPAEDLPRLFEAFYRGSSSHQTKGFGIGLSMAHQIVSLHKGGIDARNHPEGGLEIEVQLGGVSPESD